MSASREEPYPITSQEEHSDHEIADTLKEGVWYCYDCNGWYRPKEDAGIAQRAKNTSPQLSTMNLETLNPMNWKAINQKAVVATGVILGHEFHVFTSAEAVILFLAFIYIGQGLRVDTNVTVSADNTEAKN